MWSHDVLNNLAETTRGKVFFPTPQQIEPTLQNIDSEIRNEALPERSLNRVTSRATTLSARKVSFTSKRFDRVIRSEVVTDAGVSDRLEGMRRSYLLISHSSDAPRYIKTRTAYLFIRLDSQKGGPV
jgi:hypothetical protein